MDNRLLINNGISSELWEKVIVNLVILHYIIKVKTKIETFIEKKRLSFTFTQSKGGGGRNDNLPNNARQEEENWSQRDTVRCQETTVSKETENHMAERKIALYV